MPVDSFLDTVNKHLTGILTLIASLGAFLALKKKLLKILIEIRDWFTRPKRIEELLLKGADERIALTKNVESLTLDVKKLSYAMFNDGINGVQQQMARFAACHSANFEAAPYPAFESTLTGHTTRVNGAYRILIGAWSDKHIASSRWQQTLHGPLVASYVAEFERCAEAKDDFIGVCDFRNPMTDEHRGRWRVHAPSAMLGEDCLYLGRFIAALDDKAKAIAKEEGWLLNTPS